MADTYPNAPTKRIPWHFNAIYTAWNNKFGNAATGNDIAETGDYAGIASEPGRTVRESLNDEQMTTAGARYGDRTTNDHAGIAQQHAFDKDNRTTYWGAIILPDAHDIWASWINVDRGGTSNHETTYSVDTTHGRDGTWVDSGVTFDHLRDEPVEDFRSITPWGTPAVGVRGVRFRVRSVNIFTGADIARSGAFHLYGVLSPGVRPDRLLVVDNATGLAFTGPGMPGTFLPGGNPGDDWGDRALGSLDEYTIRIRNNSASYSASDIDVFFDALSPGASAAGNPGASDQFYTLESPPGAGFAPTLNISSLGPGADSGPIVVRLNIPGTYPFLLGGPPPNEPHSAWLQVHVDSWSV